MDLDISALLRPMQPGNPEVHSVEGQKYLTLTLPAPYQLNVQINVRNYKEEIEYICKRKNIPRDMQEFIVRNFEKSLAAKGSVQPPPSQNTARPPKELTDMKKISSTTTNTNLRTTMKQQIQHNSTASTIADRDKERSKRQAINLSAQMFKKVTREIAEEKADLYSSRKAQPRQYNPEIFERLHTETFDCNKETCKHTSTAQRMKDTDYLELRDRPVINSRSRQMGVTQKQPKASQEDSIHNRLYRQHIQRGFRTEKKKLERLQAQQSAGPIINSSNKYLKNYRPFMSRLEEEVLNLRKKKQFLSLSTVDFATNQQLFHPTINRTKAKPRVYDYLNRSLELPSKKQKETIEAKPEIDIMNRSTEIVRNREEQYVRSLGQKLFRKGRLVLDADTIGLLSDKEFSIIYPFLSRMEDERSMTRSHFEESFEKYFAKLTVSERHELKYQDAPDRRAHCSKIEASQQFPFKPKLNQNSVDLADDHYYESVLEFV